MPQAVEQTGYSINSWTDGLFHRQLDRRVMSQQLDRRVIPQAVGQKGYITDSWTDGICHR